MATPSREFPRWGFGPTPAANKEVDDVILPILVRLAASPVHYPGVLRPDGPSAPLLRAVALRWCAAEEGRGVFDHDAVQGLRVAMEEYTDDELAEMVRGAAIVYGVPVR